MGLKCSIVLEERRGWVFLYPPASRWVRATLAHFSAEPGTCGIPVGGSRHTRHFAHRRHAASSHSHSRTETWACTARSSSPGTTSSTVTSATLASAPAPARANYRTTDTSTASGFGPGAGSGPIGFRGSVGSIIGPHVDPGRSGAPTQQAVTRALQLV